MADLLATYPPLVWLALLVAGTAIGLLAGLLGVGGGIIAVPVLLEVFAAIGLAPTLSASLAIGTAQAVIFMTALPAAAAHKRAGTIDLDLVRTWRPALAAGTLVGLLAGQYMSAELLAAGFALVATLLAVKMTLSEQHLVAARPLGPWGHKTAAGLVGIAASAFGVGGGTLSTPVLSMFSFHIRRAIGAATLFNLIVSLPATAVFLAAGWGLSNKPVDAVGYVAIGAAFALSLPALLVAPIAAHWSSRAPVMLLRRLFALCLAAIAVRMLMRS